MQFLHLPIKFISERFFASVMHSKENVFLLCRYSNIRFELYLLTEACTCNKNRLLQKHIQKLLPISLLIAREPTGFVCFTVLFSKAVINTIKPLTDTDQINAFVVDNSLFERTSYRKHTRIKSFVHISMRYTKRDRLMTLGWTDENTFIPACIFCVRNKKDWIAFICTDTSLTPEEILRIYGKR